MKRQFSIIQIVSIIYTIIGMAFVEIMTKTQWSEHIGVVILASIALTAAYGWISFRFLQGNIFRITTVAILYIGYWFILYFIWRGLYSVIFPDGKVISMNFLSMAMNLAYWWIIILGGMIGYVAIYLKKNKEYKAIQDTYKVKRNKSGKGKKKSK